MASRDERASYYDLELPDGTRTEVWAVLRAVLSPEEALGYAKGCILARVMRDGRKDVDRLREAEKVGIEAGMLREAMKAYLATPDPMTAALDAVDSHDPRECEERASTLVMERDDAWEEMEKGKARIAELERERDEYRRLYEAETAAGKKLSETHTRATADYIAATDEADAERDRWRKTTERVEADLDALRKTLETERDSHVRLALERDRLRDGLNALRETYDAEMEFRAEMRRELGARDDEGFPEFLRRVCRELAALRDRYRPRRQSEEPAPEGKMVSVWGAAVARWATWRGECAPNGAIWTHQPPAPGEGE